MWKINENAPGQSNQCDLFSTTWLNSGFYYIIKYFKKPYDVAAHEAGL